MTITMNLASYFVFVAVASGLLFFRNNTRMLWLVLLTGLAWLPPAAFPDAWTGAPWTLIGAGLPSLSGVGKLQVIGIFGAIVASIRYIREGALLGWTIPDAMILLFCLYPIGLSVLFQRNSVPVAFWSSAYLIASWGTVWLIGRCTLRTASDWTAFCQAISLVSLSLVPFALWETVGSLRLYETVFGPHPFGGVGQSRWLGNRPLLMFEDGNQYGLWMGIAAFCAVWLWRGRPNRSHLAVAATLAAMTFLSQSFGAILLYCSATAALFIPGLWRWLVIAAVTTALSIGMLIAAHVSGFIDAKRLLLDWTPSRVVFDALRAAGRGSFAWRFGQDLQTLPELGTRIFLGTGQWDWFRIEGTRPWGFIQLAIGQYGLAGVSILGAALIGALLQLRRIGTAMGSAASGMTIAVAMAVADAGLNSFLFYPGIAIVGGIVSFNRRLAWPRPSEDTRMLRSD